MKRWAYLALGTALVGGAAFWVLTRPSHVDPATFAGLSGDTARGELAFAAAGCAACHMAPDASGEASRVLSGGMRFDTAFGTFVAPNISPDPEQGIGNWTLPQFADAVLAGVSPEGQHYYPAFPWDSYRAMAPQDLVDIHAYIQTLPASAAPSQPHELPLPFQFRRGIGLWKLAFAREGWVIPDDTLGEEAQRGRYLAEVMGHCAECHTPRNVTGALDLSRWMAGGPDASGKGMVPNITPGRLDWTEDEIAEYLSSGFTPDYDSAGGHMAHVVENYALLPASDRSAVAAYLKALPAIP